MLTYKVLLQGLVYGETEYVDIPITIVAETDKEANDKITDAIYTIRLDNNYFRMKYISKVLQDETQCSRDSE